jgi:hypothetical protein
MSNTAAQRTLLPTAASKMIEPVECQPPFDCTQGGIQAFTIDAGSILLLIAPRAMI